MSATSRLAPRTVFAAAFILFAAVLFATALDAWSGPTATAPSGNVAAPINVGTTDQVKDAGISVNSFAVFGSQYIENKLGINKTSPVVALHVVGSMILGNGSETCQAVTEGAQRYNSSTKKMEFCNGTEWGPIGSSGPLEVIAYANFSHGGGTLTTHASYNLTITPSSPGGRYVATMANPADDLNYLTFFSSEYTGGAATDMYELSADSTSQFTFQCDHSPYYGNRYCGSHASVVVMAATSASEESSTPGATHTMYQAQGSPGSCGWSTSPTYCSTSEFSDACWDNIQTIGQCEEGVNCPVMPGHTAGQQIGSCPAPL